MYEVMTDSEFEYWREAKAFVKSLAPEAVARKAYKGDYVIFASPRVAMMTKPPHCRDNYELARVGVLGGARWAWIVAALKLGWEKR